MNSITAKKKLENLILFIAGLLIAAIIIQFIGVAKNQSKAFPSIFVIFKEFFVLLGKSQTYKEILITLIDLLIAVACSLFIGIGLGVLGGISDIARGLLKPFTIIFRSVPMIVLIVIIMITVPYDRYRFVPSVVAILAMIPIVYEATVEGIKRLDSQMMDVWKMNSNLNLMVITHIHLPLISGYIKQALINAAGMGIRIIVTAEYVSNIRNSIGNSIFDARYDSDYAVVYAYAILMILIVLIIEYLPALIIYVYNKLKKREK